MPGAVGQTRGVVAEGLTLRRGLVRVDGDVGRSIELMLVPQPILSQLVSEAGHALNLLLVGEDNA